MSKFLSFLSSVAVAVSCCLTASFAHAQAMQNYDPNYGNYVHKEGSKNPFEPDDFIKLSNESSADIGDVAKWDAAKKQLEFRFKQEEIVAKMWLHEIAGDSSISNIVNASIERAKQNISGLVNGKKSLLDIIKEDIQRAAQNTPSLSGFLDSAGNLVTASWRTSNLKNLISSQNTVAKDLNDLIKEEYGNDEGLLKAGQELIRLGEEAQSLKELADSADIIEDSADGKTYVYVTEDGQQIYFVKNEMSMISSPYTTISGVTKGCMPLPAKIAENRSCFFCPLFLTIFNAAQVMSTNAFSKLATPIATVLMVGFAIYIAFLVLQHVSSMSAQTSAKFLNSLFAQAFKVLFAYLLLTNPNFVYDKFIGPVLDAGTELGGALLFEEGSGYMEWCSVEENIESKTQEFIMGVDGDSSAQLKEGLIPSYLYVKISCFIRSVQAEISTMQSIGSTLMCVSRNAAVESKWAGIPDFSMMIQGFIIWVMSLIMSLAFAFYLIDATVRIGILGALMPFFIASWPFKPTRIYTQKGWQLFLNTFFVYAMMGLVVSVNLQLIVQGLSTGTGGLNEIESAINGNNVYKLKDLLDIGFSGFLVLIACCLFAFKLTGQSNAIAEQFAGGAGENIGSSIGTLAYSGATSAAKGTFGLGKKAMKATGGMAAARKVGDKVKDKALSAIGLGRYSGKAGKSGAAGAGGGRRNGPNGGAGGPNGGAGGPNGGAGGPNGGAGGPNGGAGGPNGGAGGPNGGADNQNAQSSAPNAQAGAPAQQPAAPNPQAGAPAQQQPAPNAQAGAPAQQQPAPNAQAGAPAQQQPAPRPQAGAPAQQQPAPNPQADAPAQQQPAPNPQAGDPAQQQAAPRPQAGAPAQQQAAPRPQAGAPAQQQPAPNAQAGAPAQQPAAPNAQAGAPAQQQPAPNPQAGDPAQQQPAPNPQAGDPAQQQATPNAQAGGNRDANDRGNQNQQEANDIKENIKKERNKLEQKEKEIKKLKKKIDELKKQIENSKGSSMLTSQQMYDLNTLLKMSQGHLNNLIEQQNQMNVRLAALMGMENRAQSGNQQTTGNNPSDSARRTE